MSRGRFVDNTDAFMRDMQKAIDEGLEAAAFEASKLSARSMPGSGAAAIGKTPTGRNIYRASTPGSPPGIRTGTLRNSIGFARIRRGVWGFGTNLKYGRFLELGTSRMAERPFLRPVIVEHDARLERAFTRKTARAMARGVTRG